MISSLHFCMSAETEKSGSRNDDALFIDFRAAADLQDRRFFQERMRKDEWYVTKILHDSARVTLPASQRETECGMRDFFNYR